VKAVLATALIAALVVTGLSLWGAVHARRMAVSSSQIFIHGTPVCVLERAGEIRASVGICGVPGTGLRGDDTENHREDSPREPGFGLPPGHPPVDNPPVSDEGRRILI